MSKILQLIENVFVYNVNDPGTPSLHNLRQFKDCAI